MVGLKTRRACVVAALTLAACGLSRNAAAQLDPLLFLKRGTQRTDTTTATALLSLPTVLLAVDTSARMNVDADGNTTPSAGTRISVARAALTEGLNENGAYGSSHWSVLRFGLIPMGQIGVPAAKISARDDANAIRAGLSGLTPVTTDIGQTLDAPINTLLADAKAEAVPWAGADCQNTAVVLVVGGGEVLRGAEDAATMAAQLATTANLFLNIGANHRVPIYVVAIAPPAGDVASLKTIAANSGGVYTEISKDMINRAIAAGRPVPELVRAINLAVGHTFAAEADFDTDPTATLPIGPFTEFQVTSPIIGTANLEGALDISGGGLVNDVIENPTTHVKIPQRSNLMVTSGFTLPGFGASLRGFRVYRPVADDTKASGFKFEADGTPLWVASVPDAASRNIFTALPDGTVVAFDAAHATDLGPYLNTTDPATLITFIRNLPLGVIVDSTPAVMDAPSLDPPPDTDYPAFADANKERRTIIWVGANDGMLHAIDGRLGKEVWAFIPFNLLPKLYTLQNGQPVGNFRFFVDGSPKVADVKIDGAWHTYLVIGEGPGGTFYQTFDVTLPHMADIVSVTSNALGAALSYFANPGSVPLAWTFPRYSSFDVSIAPYGDIATAAAPIEKTVGETWSDPAVGQLGSATGLYAVLTGSGYLEQSVEQHANRGGIAAGTTFYVLDAKTGTVKGSVDVPDDDKGVGESGSGVIGDNCAAVGDLASAPLPNCSLVKNALQADPVATGPPDSRFITKAYMGDLDGTIWRFNINPDGSVAAHTQLFTNEGKGPLFASMATVNVGGTKQYLFQGGGSDLLPSAGVSLNYQLVVVLDNGATGSNTATIQLEKTDGLTGDEKVTSFPAVAGGIVFFTTTTFKPQSACTPPDANLYAVTVAGGPAYDTNGDNTITKKGDSVKVRTSVGARASAPVIVDQHVVFAAGNKIELFGDPLDFNNGVGQMGVRILSWREVR